MSAKTAEQLQNKLFTDRVWRRQELSEVFKEAKSARGSVKDALLRSFWLLQYAHWEGFVKNCVDGYIEFLCARRLKYGELKDSHLLFPTSPVYRLLRDIEQSGFQSDTIEKLFLVRDIRVSKKYMKFTTESNLRFEVLRKISQSLSLTLDENIDDTYLDKMLADRRNSIAHGEYVRITIDDAKDMRDRCGKWMDDILDKIVSAAELKNYLK